MWGKHRPAPPPWVTPLSPLVDSPWEAGTGTQPLVIHLSKELLTSSLGSLP